MKLIIVLTIFFVVAAAFFGVRAMATGGSKGPNAPADEMYVGLRNLALGTKAADIGLKPTHPREPYAIVMDMDVSGRTATITSFGTGDASLYLSTGGGTIGSGQASEEVAAAAKKFVAAAAQYVDSMTKADKQPMPGSGEVIFYVLTPDGVYAVAKSEEALGDGKDSFSPLFYAGQTVLTQIRLLQERQDREREQRK